MRVQIPYITQYLNLKYYMADQKNLETIETDKQLLNPEMSSPPGLSLSVSPYTKALISAWQKPAPHVSLSPNKISVSQTVSFLAFLYEKMRNAVEFREEHLIRRAAIERIIKRRMVLNENGREIAEPLIKELLWARYYENNSFAEEIIGQLQTVIDKYFFIRNEIARGRSGKEQDKIASFILEILSCEIEEVLLQDPKREAFTNFVYQLIRPHIAPFADEEMEKDIQVYIAVEKTFAHSDLPLIRYHLCKIMLPEITTVTWKTSDTILDKLYDVYKIIETNIQHPLADKTRNIVKKQIPPYLILKDVFLQNPNNITEILSDEKQLQHKVDQACRKRYDETKDRLRRMGIRSFIYIVLTKVIFAFLLEIPYDVYILKSISYMPIIINVIFPPALMSIILLSVTVPGDDNTRKISNLIKGIIAENPQDHSLIKNALVVGKKEKRRSIFFSTLFSGIYLLTYLITFGAIIYGLSKLNFNPVSQAIFIFFVTLVTFFAFRVIGITQEYLVIDRDGPLTPIFDFFFLPILRVGRFLQQDILTRFNVLIFFFDFIVEMPLKAIVEVIDEWVRFVRLKKEEMM